MLSDDRLIEAADGRLSQRLSQSLDDVLIHTFYPYVRFLGRWQDDSWDEALYSTVLWLRKLQKLRFFSWSDWSDWPDSTFSAKKTISRGCIFLCYPSCKKPRFSGLFRGGDSIYSRSGWSTPIRLDHPL